MELQKIVFNSLISDTSITNYTGLRIYHKHLPELFKVNEITAVFILNTNQVESSFDESNEIEIFNLDIKLNYNKTPELYNLKDLIINNICGLNDSHILYKEYVDDLLVWNYEEGFYNLNLRFRIHYEK